MWLHSKSAVVCSIALCGTLAVPVAAHAQVIVKAGLNSSTITFYPGPNDSPLETTEHLLGFVGGVSFLVPPAPKSWAALQLEGLVGQVGGSNLLGLDDKLRVTTLSFPILLNAGVSRHAPANVYVIGGIAPTFNLHATYSVEGMTETVTDEIKRFDLGLVLGGGVVYRRMVFETRYTWGLKTLFDDGELDGSFKNNVFSVMGGFK